MNIDLQLAPSALQRVLRGQLERLVLGESLGVAGWMDLPFNLPGGEVERGLVDHVTISGVSLQLAPASIAPAETVTILAPPIHVPLPFSPPPGPPRAFPLSVAPVLIRAIIDLHCVRLSDLEEAGARPVPADRIVVFQVRANFAVAPPELVDDTLRLTPRIVSLEVGAPGLFPADPDSLPESAGDALRRIIAALNTPESLSRFGDIPPIVLNVGGIRALAGGGQRLWNAGISFVPGVLTIRLQFESEALTDGPAGLTGIRWFSEWLSFYLSGATSRLAGADWALFLPAPYFLGRVETTIVDALAGNTRFVLNADNMPRATWSVAGGMPSAASPCVPGGQAEITVRFSASAKGACVPYGFDIDVNCSIRLWFSLSPGVLRTDLHLDFAPDEGDAAVCAITNSLVLSHAGFVIGGTIGGGFIGAAVGAAIGGLLGGIGTLVASYTAGPGSFETPTLRPVEGSDRDYYTETPLPLPGASFFGSLRAEALNACLDGLAVTGSILAPQSRLQLLGRLRHEGGFRWIVEGTACLPPPFVPLMVAFSSVSLTRSPRSSGIPVVLYGITILDSTPEAYTDTAVSFDTNAWPDGVHIDMEIDAGTVRTLRDRASAEGVTEPGFRLLIQTSCGARLVFIPGIGADFPDPPYEEARRVCEARARMAEEIRRRAEDLIRYLRREPLPDDEPPPPDLREWILTVSGLDPGEVLRIGRRSPNQVFNPTMELAADGRGLITARFWELPAAGSGELAAEIRSKGGPPRNQETRVFVGSRHFQHTARIAFDGEYRGHALARLPAGIQLACVTSTGVWVYGVSNPLAPRLVAVSARTGLRGVRGSQKGFLLSGKTRDWQLDAQGRVHPARRSRQPKRPDLLTRLLGFLSRLLGLGRSRRTAEPFVIEGAPQKTARLGNVAVTLAHGAKELEVHQLVRFESN